MLELNDVWFRYGRKSPWVLAGVSLRVEHGRVTALSGPSGSGKTTLLGLLGGVLRPTKGSVQAAEPGESVWIFQQPVALMHRTAIDNVSIGFRSRGYSRREALRRSFGLLEVYGLADVAERRARTLSGGELQRVGVARVEAAGSPLLLVDEPTAQLDRANSEMVAGSLRRVADVGTTVVVATHDPAVLEVADLVYQVEDGVTYPLAS